MLKLFFSFRNENTQASVGIKLQSYITDKMSTVMYSDLNARAVTLAKIVNDLQVSV